MNIPILWIIYFVNFLTESTGSRIKGKYVQGEIIQKLEIIGLQRCARECRAITSCKAYNYDGHQLNCYIMAVDSSDGVIIDRDWSFYEDRSGIQPVPSDPCGSASCPMYTKCITTSRGSTFCVPFECSQTPPTVPNAAPTTNVNHFLIGSKLIYSCTGGFNMNGLPDITCKANKAWSTTAFTCEGCSTLPVVSNASPNTGSSAIHSERTYTCNMGYTQTGLIKTTCQSNLEWTTPSESCNIVDCGNPAVLSGTNIDEGATTYGSTRTYSCKTGYSSNNQVGTINCQSNGSWTSSSLVCTQMVCGTLPAVANANPGGGGSAVGDTRNYVCNLGYNPSGSLTATCQLSPLQWSTPTGQCNLVDCGNPSNLNGASVSSGGTTSGSTRTYSCLIGYQSNGQSGEINCQSNGSWKSPTLVCTLKNCGAAPTIANAAGSGGTNYGETWTYSCNSGYVASGPATINCLSSGNWQSTTFTCTASGCTTALSVFGAVVSGTGTSTGSTRTVTCDTAYTQTAGSGPGTSTCQSNGQWSDSGVTCQACASGSLASTFTLRSNRWFDPPVGFTPSISGGSVDAASCRTACLQRSDFVCVAAYYRKNPSGYCVVRPQRIYDSANYPSHYSENPNYDEYIRNCN